MSKRELRLVEQRSKLLDTIDQFLNSPETLESVLKDVKIHYNEATVSDLKGWFSAFKVGIKYVYDKYGLIADNILIVQDISFGGRILDDTIVYIPDDGVDTIAITHKFLAKSLIDFQKNNLLSSGFLSKHSIMVSSRDFPIILGVEEAHHSYFLKSFKGLVPKNPGKYDDDIELEAGKEQIKAIKDLKIKVYVK